ncbi:MAG: hypothetical protein IPJ08_09920 [Burkholderiales bacterium]|nr:hypothetical protein [Burkholderiales bacterium]
MGAEEWVLVRQILCALDYFIEWRLISMPQYKNTQQLQIEKVIVTTSEFPYELPFNVFS